MINLDVSLLYINDTLFFRGDKIKVRISETDFYGRLDFINGNPEVIALDIDEFEKAVIINVEAIKKVEKIWE